jgi:hypothetical protein
MRRAIQAAHKIDEVKSIRDKAVALQAYAKQANDDEMLVWVREIKLRAERRAGELLRETERAAGSRKQLAGRNSSGGTIRLPPEKTTPKLKDLGITKRQSANWQQLANVPAAKFEQLAACPTIPASATDYGHWKLLTTQSDD